MPAIVSPSNCQVTNLQSQTFTSGGTVTIPVAGALPTGRRVRSVVFRLDIDATQPGAGMAAQLGTVLPQLIAQIKIGRRVSITGLGLFFLNWMQNGFSPAWPPGWAAGAAADVRSRSIVWQLDYADMTSVQPEDAAVPSEIWTDPIEIRFGTNAIFAATVPTLGNGTLRTMVYHDAASVSRDGKRITVPQSLNIQSEDFSALSAIINKPGAWVYACAYREASNDSGIITSANVANVISSIDGVPLLNSLRLQDVASVFNAMRSHGSNYGSEGQALTVPGANNATSGTAIGGECVNDQPGVAAGAGQAVTANFLPLVFPPRNYHVSMLAKAKTGFRSDLTGTLGAYKIAYRIIERRPDSAVGNAARRLGVGSGGFGPKTGNSPIHTDPELAPFLPYTVVES
jgi:hypothetical protein